MVADGATRVARTVEREDRIERAFSHLLLMHSFLIECLLRLTTNRYARLVMSADTTRKAFGQWPDGRAANARLLRDLQLEE
jgi:hypothetical protein